MQHVRSISTDVAGDKAASLAHPLSRNPAVASERTRKRAERRVQTAIGTCRAPRCTEYRITRIVPFRKQGFAFLLEEVVLQLQLLHVPHTRPRCTDCSLPRYPQI